MKGSTNRGAIVAAMIAVAGVGATGSNASAQDSEIVRQIESLAQDNAPLYLNPIARGLGG